jgi:hypothetical protein
MARWFQKITADPTDFSPIVEMIEHFQSIYEAAQADLAVRGKRIEEVAMRIPGLVEMRFAQYQELETVLLYLERVEAREIMEKMKLYWKTEPRDLSDNYIRKWAESHEDVITIARIRLEVATVRNNFLSLHKGLETLHYQLGNVTKLRCAGLDDATF